ncbi:MAG: hypothetical protein MJB14_00490 [Spirochaetes bacterium]|nr:hypothetical protein [Spirochaetota bacterium]
MLNKKIIYLIVFIICSSFLYSQDYTIGSIEYENLKFTNRKYLDKKLDLQVGGLWNEAVKERITKKLIGMDDIIEAVEITETIVDDKAYIVIHLVEKWPLMVIPLAKYSNSSGIQPKFQIRVYNLAGFRKYFKFKFDYIPKENIYGELLYKDPEFFGIPDLSFEISTGLSSSVSAYYVYAPPSRVGIIGETETQQWNKDLYINSNSKMSLSYKIPDNGMVISPSFKFNNNNLLTADPADDSISGDEDSDNYGKTPITSFNPGGGPSSKYL